MEQRKFERKAPAIGDEKYKNYAVKPVLDHLRVRYFEFFQSDFSLKGHPMNADDYITSPEVTGVFGNQHLLRPTYRITGEKPLLSEPLRLGFECSDDLSDLVARKDLYMYLSCPISIFESPYNDRFMQFLEASFQDIFAERFNAIEYVCRKLGEIGFWHIPMSLPNDFHASTESIHRPVLDLKTGEEAHILYDGRNEFFRFVDGMARSRTYNSLWFDQETVQKSVDSRYFDSMIHFLDFWHRTLTPKEAPEIEVGEKGEYIKVHRRQGKESL